MIGRHRRMRRRTLDEHNRMRRRIEKVAEEGEAIYRREFDISHGPTGQGNEFSEFRGLLAQDVARMLRLILDDKDPFNPTQNPTQTRRNP